MPAIAWVAIAASVGLLLFWRMASPAINRSVARAIRDKSVAGVVEAIDKRSATAQPTLYNHAIRRLWDAYERELATELVRELTQRHHETSIAQYWLKQVAQAEPNLATTILTKPFFDSYYLPEIAAKCGPVG